MVDDLLRDLAGAAIWVYLSLSEIFPNAVRARGQSVGTTTHWVMNAIIANIFPTLAMHGMAVPFPFFGSMMVLQLIFVLACGRRLAAQPSRRSLH